MPSFATHLFCYQIKRTTTTITNDTGIQVAKVNMTQKRVLNSFIKISVVQHIHTYVTLFRKAESEIFSFVLFCLLFSIQQQFFYAFLLSALYGPLSDKEISQ